MAKIISFLWRISIWIVETYWRKLFLRDGEYLRFAN